MYATQSDKIQCITCLQSNFYIILDVIHILQSMREHILKALLTSVQSTNEKPKGQLQTCQEMDIQQKGLWGPW